MDDLQKETVLARLKQELDEEGIKYNEGTIIQDPSFNFLNAAMSIVQDEQDFKVLIHLAGQVARVLKRKNDQDDQRGRHKPEAVRRIFLPKHILNDHSPRCKYLKSNQWYWVTKKKQWWTYWSSTAEALGGELSSRQLEIV